MSPSNLRILGDQTTLTALIDEVNQAAGAADPEEVLELPVQGPRKVDGAPDHDYHLDAWMEVAIVLGEGLAVNMVYDLLRMLRLHLKRAARRGKIIIELNGQPITLRDLDRAIQDLDEDKAADVQESLRPTSPVIRLRTEDTPDPDA